MNTVSDIIISGEAQKDLVHLREWISKQPHLNARTDDKSLLLFLRGCKYSLQRTKEKIENYYSLKTKLPEFFSNLDPLDPKSLEILKLGLCLPLPRIEGDELSVCYVRCKPLDASKILFSDVVKVIIMIFHIVMIEDANCSSAKLSVVCDSDGMNINHFLQLTPVFCKKLIACFHNTYPLRPQGFHLINFPSVFESIINMVKPLLGTKLSQRFKVYSESSKDSLYKDIPVSIIPKDCGGLGTSLDELTDIWMKKTISYRDWFLEDNKYLCDESKRIDNVYASNLFGVEGSFKQLCID